MPITLKIKDFGALTRPEAYDHLFKNLKIEGCRASEPEMKRELANNDWAADGYIFRRQTIANTLRGAGYEEAGRRWAGYGQPFVYFRKDQCEVVAS